MESNDTHVAIGGLNLIEFLINIQSIENNKILGERIFNLILRGLSFPHTDNFIVKSLDILTSLIRYKIYPI
jgi:hypothetical protein